MNSSNTTFLTFLYINSLHYDFCCILISCDLSCDGWMITSHTPSCLFSFLCSARKFTEVLANEQLFCAFKL